MRFQFPPKFLSFRRYTALAALLVAMGGSGALAQTPQQTWSLVQAQLALNRTYVAHEIRSRYEMTGGRRPESGQYTTMIKDWDTAGEPVRLLKEQTTAEIEGMKNAVLGLKFGTRIANYPDVLPCTVGGVVLLRTERGEGGSVRVLSTIPDASRAEQRCTLTAWVDEQTSRPLRVEAVFTEFPLGINSLNVSITYLTDHHGRSLPEEVSVSTTFTLLFKSGKAVFQQTLSDWRKRPPRPAP